MLQSLRRRLGILKREALQLKQDKEARLAAKRKETPREKAQRRERKRLNKIEEANIKREEADCFVSDNWLIKDGKWAPKQLVKKASGGLT